MNRSSAHHKPKSVSAAKSPSQQRPAFALQRYKFGALSITHQVLIFLLLFLGAACATLYRFAIETGIESELNHTRTLVDTLESFRTFVAKNGGVYVRREASEDIATVGRYLASYETTAADKDGQTHTYTFHQKNPFLALSDLSQVVAESKSRVKFRLAAENYMNASNAPDAFELQAMAHMRETGDKEYWAVSKGQLRYARALIAEQSCMKCHGDADSAPAVVRANYRPPIGGKVGGGYGYQLGNVVGVTSATAPHQTPIQMLQAQGAPFWSSVAALLALIVFAFVLVIRGIVRPLQEQTAYATALVESSNPREVTPPALRGSLDDANELTKAQARIMSLHESLVAVQDHIEESIATTTLQSTVASPSTLGRPTAPAALHSGYHSAI